MLIFCITALECFTVIPFPPTGNGSLNRLYSGFLEPWCQLVNQLTFPPVLSKTIVIMDASLTGGIAQCTKEVNSSSQMVDHIDYLWVFVLLLQIFVLFHCILHCCNLFLLQTNDTPTDVVMVCTGKTAFLVPGGDQLFSFWTNQFLSKCSSKFGAWYRTEPFPCVRKGLYVLHFARLSVAHKIPLPISQLLLL